METLIGKIREKVEELLPGKNYFVVNVSLKGGKGHQRLEVLIDGDDGIDIDTCSRVNHALSEWLDETDPVKGRYVLEVGSPGVDYPLSSRRQYNRNIGKELKIIMKDNSVKQGKLLKAEEGKILVNIRDNRKGAGNTLLHIDLDEIRKSTVIVSLK